jgi:hypothetical protein
MMARTDESQYVLTATYERACESHLWTGSVRTGNWEMTAVAVQQSDFLHHVTYVRQVESIIHRCTGENVSAGWMIEFF